MRLTHYINLPGLGGIERLFLAFIDSTADEIEHSILLKGRTVPLSVERHLPAFKGSLISYKRWGSVDLPGWPRRLRSWALQARLSREHPPDGLLVWSQLNADDIAGACRKRGAKVIHYEHGSAWLSRPSTERCAYLDRTDAIICASQACARMLALRWNVPDAKLSVVKNPLLPELLPGKRPQKSFVHEGRPWTLGTAGRLVPVKGHYLAISTLAILAHRGIDCRLLIAGDGPLKEALEAFAAMLGIGDKVQFLGFVEDMGSFYEAIDVFLCPSLREPFGLVSLEAAAWGCPVVAACVDGLPETMIDGASERLVIPTREPDTEAAVLQGALPAEVYNPLKDRISRPLEVDPRVMAAVVETLLGDVNELKRISNSAMEMVPENYSYDDYLRRMISLLRAECFQ